MYIEGCLKTFGDSEDLLPPQKNNDACVVDKNEGDFCMHAGKAMINKIANEASQVVILNDVM